MRLGEILQKKGGSDWMLFLSGGHPWALLPLDRENQNKRVAEAVETAVGRCKGAVWDPLASVVPVVLKPLADNSGTV